MRVEQAHTNKNMVFFWLFDQAFGESTHNIIHKVSAAGASKRWYWQSGNLSRAWENIYKFVYIIIGCVYVIFTEQQI
jgi:hypothetical protein